MEGMNMNRLSKTALILVALAAVLFFAAVFLSQPPPEPKAFVEKQELAVHENALFKYTITKYPSVAGVSNASGENLSVGLAAETSSLNFGIVPTGGSYSTKRVTVANTNEIPVMVSMKAYGTVAQFVEFSMSRFMLKKDESAKVDIIFRTKKDTATGDYSGEIDVIARQPRYGFLSALDGVL